MKRRIAVWACAGFLLAACWGLYAFAAGPEQFIMSMKEPLMQALVFVTCPVSFAGRYFAISLWWALAINAATYALIGVIAETLRRKSNRALVLGLLMALALFPLESQAQSSPTQSKVTFAGGGKTVTFPFEWREGMIFIPVRLNGSKPLSFVLDSGSAKTLVDRTLAASLGLKASGTGSIQGAGAGRIPIEFIPDVSVGLPGIECAGFELSTADLRPLETSAGAKVDGIIGYELLRRLVVTVDYEGKTLTLTLPEAFRASGKADAIPIEVRDKWAYVKAELRLPGPVTVQDSFMIDSGSSDAVDHPIVMNLQSRVATTSGAGLGSPVQGATARATSLRLGPYSVSGPTVSCCGATEDTSKLIGSEVLRRFTVTFDYPGSQILLTRNAHFAEPFPQESN
jgi:hypothetical protein